MGERAPPRSRLDSAIDRLLAQRACLDAAIALLDDRPGPVLELGLGNGRTYHHLKTHLPDRVIQVFERAVNAHAGSLPPPECLILGDLYDTLPAAARRLGRCAVLVHADIGRGDPDTDAALAALLSATLPRMTAAGGLILCDQPLTLPSARPLALPADIAADRYFLWRLEDAPPAG